MESQDRTLDESVESSLGRIEKAFQNPKNLDEVMKKRQDALDRQRDRVVVSSPCPGFSFSTSHYPPALQELLLQCGGVLLPAKIQFYCSYSTQRTNENTLVRVFKGKWKFKGSCFGCETLKDLAWNAIKDYFINIKVGVIYKLNPPISIHKLDQWLV
jgi:hypothetical protein